MYSQYSLLSRYNFACSVLLITLTVWTLLTASTSKASCHTIPAPLATSMTPGFLMFFHAPVGLGSEVKDSITSGETDFQTLWKGRSPLSAVMKGREKQLSVLLFHLWPYAPSFGIWKKLTEQQICFLNGPVRGNSPLLSIPYSNCPLDS